MNIRGDYTCKGGPQAGVSGEIRYQMLRRVMLVEDDFDDQFFAREELKRAKGVGKVICFSNGKALLEFLSQEIEKDKNYLRAAPTVIVLDLNMPLMSGLEVLNELKSNPALKGIPIIIVTGEQSPWEIEKAFSFKADAVFKKPFNVGKLRKFFEEGSHWSWSSLWH